MNALAAGKRVRVRPDRVMAVPLHLARELRNAFPVKSATDKSLSSQESLDRSKSMSFHVSRFAAGVRNHASAGAIAKADMGCG